jgi:hypothetical protein
MNLRLYPGGGFQKKAAAFISVIGTPDFSGLLVQFEDTHCAKTISSKA